MRASLLPAGRGRGAQPARTTARHGRARRVRAHAGLQRPGLGRRRRRRRRLSMGPGGRLDGHPPKGQEARKERGAGPGPQPRRNPQAALPFEPSTPLRAGSLSSRTTLRKGPRVHPATRSNVVSICFNEFNCCPDTNPHPHPLSPRCGQTWPCPGEGACPGKGVVGTRSRAQGVRLDFAAVQILTFFQFLEKLNRFFPRAELLTSWLCFSV